MWLVAAVALVFRRAGIVPGYPLVIGIQTGFMLLGAGVFLARWRSIASNLAGRQQAKTVLLLMASIPTVQSLAFLSGVPIHLGAAAGVFVLAVGFSMQALTNNVSPVLPGSTALLGAFFLAWSGDLMLSAAIAAFLLGALGLFYAARSQRPS
jgi:hypothetical protein